MKQFVGLLALFFVLYLCASFFAGMPERERAHAPPFIKLTYERQGQREVKTIATREMGEFGALGAFFMEVLQNGTAQSSIRPVSRIVKIEHCPDDRCFDWTPRRR